MSECASSAFLVTRGKRCSLKKSYVIYFTFLPFFLSSLHLVPIFFIFHFISRLYKNPQCVVGEVLDSAGVRSELVRKKCF